MDTDVSTLDFGFAGRRSSAVHGHFSPAIPYTRKLVALSEIDPSRARIVDLNERTELRPLIRLWEIGLPGLSCGWHLLRNRRRAVVAIFGGRRALWLPTQLNFDLLLELQHPQTLLDALHARR